MSLTGVPSADRFPRMIRLKQQFPGPTVADATEATRQALAVGARPLFFTWQNINRAYPPPFRWFEPYVYRRSAHAIAGNAEAVDVLRAKGTPAEAMGLTDPTVSEELLLAAMVAEPVLVNRPIVVTPKGTRLCRPSEEVLELLEQRPDSFTKEDGEVVRIRP